MSKRSRDRFQPRAHLEAAALVSFIVAFIAARTFTTFFPSIVIVSSGIHIHHFWFGIALLAVGGWVGISYNDKETDRLAAIIFGAGGGLIADEVGLLLTFENYWTTLTYTFLIIFFAFIAILYLFYKYHDTIATEFAEFTRSNMSFYFGVFLFAISTAFIVQTENMLVAIVASGLAIAAMVIIVTYVAQQIRKNRQRSS